MILHVLERCGSSSLSLSLSTKNVGIEANAKYVAGRLEVYLTDIYLHANGRSGVEKKCPLMIKKDFS